MIRLLNIPGTNTRPRPEPCRAKTKEFRFGDTLVTFDPNTLNAVSREEDDALIFVPSTQAPARPPAPPDRPTSLTLVVTTDCNGRCRYCYMPKDGSARMSEDVAVRALDLLDPARPWRISFFGGEPLLCIPVIARVMSEARARAQHGVAFGLTTNGLLVTLSSAHMFRGQRVILSVDGPEEIHEDARPGSFDGALRALGLFSARRVDVTLRATFDAAPAHLVERLTFLNDLCNPKLSGAVAIEPALYGGPCPEADEVAGEYREASDWFVARVREGSRPRFQHYEMLLRRLLRREYAVTECSAGCGYVAVAPDGAVYPCHTLAGDPIGCSGNELWAAGAWRQNAVQDQPDCMDCWARYLCGGGCRVARSQRYCDYMRLWCTEALYIASQLTPEEAGRITT